jgi:hypothetical protein
MMIFTFCGRYHHCNHRLQYHHHELHTVDITVILIPLLSHLFYHFMVPPNPFFITACNSSRSLGHDFLTSVPPVLCLKQPVVHSNRNIINV